jgi:two-component system alkaline phosphatase synthesis response regulator PhoP
VIRLLIVTEDTDAKTGLGESLVLSGFTYSLVSFEEALAHLEREPFDLVLAEINSIQPDSSAWEVVNSLKKRRRLPVIALVPSEILGNIDGFLDVDDFIVIPGNPAELALRARLLLSRAQPRDSGEIIKCDGLVIDLVTCEVAVDGKIMELTFKEYEMLKLLAGNPGRVFTREQLLDKIWGYDYFGGDRTVDVHVRRLRSKIEDAHHTFIETVRNIGYRFRKEH